DRQPRREPAAHAERHPHAAAGRRRAVLPQPHVPSPSPGRWAGARSSPSGPAPGAARTATREPARPAPEALALPYGHPRRTVHPCPPPSPADVAGGRSHGRVVGGLLGHVDEAAVVALERDGDGGGGPVAVLGDDQVGLTGARRLLLVGVLAVQQDHHVRILLDAV